MLEEIKTERDHFFVDKHGSIQGEAKSFYSNGQLFRQCSYVKGIRHGDYKFWDKDGNLCSHLHFENGKLTAKI